MYGFFLWYYSKRRTLTSYFVICDLFHGLLRLRKDFQKIFLRNIWIVFLISSQLKTVNIKFHYYSFCRLFDKYVQSSKHFIIVKFPLLTVGNIVYVFFHNFIDWKYTHIVSLITYKKIYQKWWRNRFSEFFFFFVLLDETSLVMSMFFIVSIWWLL